jgi:hypothetical protein
VILISEDLINRSLGDDGEVEDCDEEHATTYDRLYDGEDEGEEEELKADAEADGDGEANGDAVSEDEVDDG